MEWANDMYQLLMYYEIERNLDRFQLSSKKYSTKEMRKTFMLEIHRLRLLASWHY